MISIGSLSDRQLTNAQTIYRAALPYGRDAVKAALMAAGDESSYLRYQNNGKTTRVDVPQKWRDLAAISMQFPGDAIAGEEWTTADSIGLFQQRLMFGYSSPDRAGVADLMDPAVSTVIFICGSSFGRTRAFLRSPTEMTLAQRVQWTQGSEHPDGGSYLELEHVAEQLIERFCTVDIPTSPAPTCNVLEIIPMTEPTAGQQTVLDGQWDKIVAKVNDQRPVDFYIYQDEKGLWMANLIAGTSWAFPDPETRGARQFVLETAGYRVEAWDSGKPVTEPGAFGQRSEGVVPGHKAKV